MKIKWYLIGEIMHLQLLVVDLFCGAGGTTSGFENSEINGKQVCRVIACLNHDENAIRSHEANHPLTEHMTEDIRVQAMGPIVKIVNRWRAMCPWAKVILWASLECTNHSNAKGGDSRDADSRSLADHLDRYIVALNPDYVWIENVREFRLWGPLMHKRHKKTGKLVYHKEKGTGKMIPTMKPDPRYLKKYFNRWVKATTALGYTYQDVDRNAAHFDAHQNRVRYFGSFAKIGQEHIFPAAFTKKGRAVKEVLDFSDEGISIFDPNRKKAITSPKTYERISAGIRKHIVPGAEEWILKYNGHSKGVPQAGTSINDPSPTVCARRTVAVGKTVFLSKYFSGDQHHSVSINDPAGTITAIDHHSKISCDMIMQYFGEGGSQNPDINKPCPAVTTKDRVAKLKLVLIDNQYGQSQPTSSEQPCGTILKNPKQNVITPVWLDNRYGSGSHNHSGPNDPCGTVTGIPKQALMTPKFVMNHNFNNEPTSVDAPIPSILASRKHYYLVQAAFNNPPNSIEQPCPTVIARQDKKPLNLATCSELKQAVPAIIIRETENEKAAPVHIFPMGTVVYNLPSGKLLNKGKKAKRAYHKARRNLLMLMASYGIVDVKMRMLLIKELLKIQGFPEDYKLIGTQSEQKKFIGNAVHTSIPKKWGEDAARMFMDHKMAA